MAFPAAPTSDPVLDDADAFAAIALVAIASDGTVTRTEAQALRHQLEHRHPYRDSNDAAMGALFDRLLKALELLGITGLLEASVPLLSTQQREVALAVAAHLVYADRQLLPEEVQVLQQLGGHLALEPGRAEQILEVIHLLHSDCLVA